MLRRGLIAGLLRLGVTVLSLMFFLAFGMCAMIAAAPAAVPMAPPSVFADIQAHVNAAMTDKQLGPGDHLDWREVAATVHVLLDADWGRYPSLNLPAHIDKWFEQQVVTVCGDESTTDGAPKECGPVVKWRIRTLREVADDLKLLPSQRDLLFTFDLRLFDQLTDVGTKCVPDGWRPDPAHGWVWPLPGFYQVTSCYGPRIDPVEFVDGHHHGLDVAAPTGAALLAPRKGRVYHAGGAGACGQSVTIEHENGYRTRLCHLSSIAVRGGEEVQAGQVIGAVGSTGKSTGPHMHVEVFHGIGTVDPLTVFWARENEEGGL